jgi:hypothetical protein
MSCPRAFEAQVNAAVETVILGQNPRPIKEENYESYTLRRVACCTHFLALRTAELSACNCRIMLFSVACSVQYRTYRVIIYTCVLVYTGVPQYRQSKCHYQGNVDPMRESARALGTRHGVISPTWRYVMSYPTRFSCDTVSCLSANGTQGEPSASWLSGTVPSRLRRLTHGTPHRISSTIK